ncbi:PKD-like family lipoprotein [Flavitalea flava]
MRYVKIFMAWAGMLCLLQACYKDKGNYKLLDYNQVISITNPTVTPVILGDTFRVSPVIKWKYPNRDTTAFDYEWRQIDSVVSTSRNLAYKPNIPGYVMLYLYIKEKATGIISRQPIQIQVISAYRAGWLLLTNNNGTSGLTFIRRDATVDASNVKHYSYKYFPDAYANNFPKDALGTGPVRLVTKAWPDYTLDQVLVVQDNSTVFLNGTDFSKVIKLSSEFPTQSFPNGAQAADYVDGGPTNFVLCNDGNIYWKKNPRTMGGIHDGSFIDIPIYFEGGGAHISQIVDESLDYSQFVYLYDDANHRFVGLYTTTGDNSYIGGKMYLINTDPPPAGFVDLNNMAGYTLKYCSDYANASFFMNIIKNNNTGEYLYQTYSLSMNYTALGVSAQQQEVFAGNGLVSDKTVYYRIRNSSYLFFGEGSKLYFYDVNTRRVTLYHDFAAGNIMRMTTDATSGELGVAFDNGDFYICSLKNDILGNADPGATGVLYKSPNNGTIIDLTWKWGSYFDYIFRRYPG